MPYVVVVTTYPGASPDKIESMVTEPLESGLGTVNGVENVTSTSNENYCTVMLEFAEDTNMDSAMVKLSNALDLITLPDGVGKPMIMEMSMDMLPVIYASVDYDGKDIYELSDFVENTVVPTMERQNGVASVDTTGVIEKTVEIRLNQEKIDALNDKLAGHVDDQLADAKSQIDDAKSQMNSAKAQLESSKKELEEKIGYNFKDSHLLRHAVTHSSYVNEKHMKKADCNERLEFLGDAVLELISSEYLFFENQTMPEGELTKLRASMVCEKALAFCARDLELGSYLLLGKGEDATGGRFRESITSDALEALIGAIYLDGGFANAKEFILKYILNDLEGKRLFYDSKTILQEMVQGGQEKGIVYQLVGEEGPDHNKSFRVEVVIGGEAFGCGIGRTKKAAEQEAAYQAILKLKEGKVQ